MSLLAVGSVAFDGVKTPYGEVERAVGGSATYFGISASYFTDVAVVAVVGEDFGEAELALFTDKGIDIRQIRREKGKSFYWKGEYNDMNEAVTLATDLNVFAGFRPEIHPDHRKTPFVFLGNIDPHLQLHVLGQMEKPRLVGMDTMNYWIHSQPAALREVLKKVDVLFVNETEARMLSGQRNTVKCARAIREMGPGAVVIKRGEFGAAAFYPGGCFMAPAFPLEDVRDTTGAGDSFAGGFMGYAASRGDLAPEVIRNAVLYGTTMASFNVEDFSVGRLKDLSFPEIESRKRDLREIMQV